MNTYSILIILCVLIIFSYFFDLFARKTNIPSVLMLLGLGCGLKYAGQYFGVAPIDFSSLLPLLGTVGLILIVLEGALELKFSRGKGKLIRQAFGASFFILLVTAFGVAFLFQYLSGATFYLSMLNAVPYAVISSAIAIPSVSVLQERKREFIVYESSFSDILGIMLFNFVLNNEELRGASFLQLGVELIVMALLCFVFCFGLLFIMGRMKHHVKFFLILASMVLIYSIGKWFHLSSLLIVLVFGLFLENIRLIGALLERRLGLRALRRVMLYKDLGNDLVQLKQFSLESAFLLRTFFFLVFGYSLDIASLVQNEVVVAGVLVLGIIISFRFIYMQFVTRSHLWPEILISPRGLITVLLFLGIPDDKRIFAHSNGLLIFIIVCSSVLMSLAIIFSGRKPDDSQMEELT